ncbi:hypothetical protein R70723_11080 [Paenibacillus sp. FSL R7-0273]|nr:hypothetical protein R70723_11080 [Paenibacillus sp. FSL R7-0273]OMF86444.1 hypothetical protein BK144_25970 [Paenibacillus sp. FSL R7-0273]
MALKTKSILGLAVVLIVLTIAAVTGGLMAKADGQTWLTPADTSWYDPDYTTFKIDTVQKLAGVAKLVNEDTDDNGNKINGLSGKIMEVDQDLNLSGYLWVPIGTGEYPFLGTLISKDGQIIEISGMNVKPDLSYQGLVGNMIGGTVGGFQFRDNGSISVTSVTYDVYAGAAVGKMSGSSIVYDINNYITVTTDSAPFTAYAGGIVGMGEGSIANSFNYGAVTANGSSAAGGIVGYADAAGLNVKKVTNSGSVLANAQGGDTVYAGGIAGYAIGTLVLNDENTVISNSAPVTVNGGATVFAGGITGKIDNTAVFSDATSNSGPVTIQAPAANATYAGGLLGAAGVITSPDMSIAFDNTAAIINNGGSNVHTGGIAGYAGSTVTWTKPYTNATDVTATGVQNIYTGGLIGYAAKGIILNNTTADAYKNTADIQASGNTVIYTGGIAGYDAGGIISNASFAGSINAVGTSEVYTGGITGYELGGSIQASQAGDVASIPTITSDGTTGGITGYLDGTLNNVSVKYIKLKATSEGGIVGGIAGSAQGTISGAIAGDSESSDYKSLIIEAAVSNTSAGADNITFGGLVGINDKALALTDSRAFRVGLLNESGKSAYTLGAAAGKLNALAVIGTKEAPVVVQDYLIDLNADNSIAGGAIGISRSSAMYIEASRITVNAKGTAAHVGGIFGENHGAAPYVLAQNITLNAQSTDALLGGVTGLNTGSLTDATAHVVNITAEGARTEVGGIAGRSAGADASNRASIITPVLHAGEEAILTVNAPDIKAGGLVGYATATDIVNPVVGATVPDYASISVKTANVNAGGLVGVLENSSLSGDATTVNLENLLLNTTKEAANGYTGGFVGYNDKSRIERLVGKALNLTINGPSATTGGMTGYNLGTDSAVITNSYITGLSLKVNATATNSTIGGIAGLNDARTGDPVLNPGTAVSSLQNSRTQGSIAVTAPNSKLGGMVGENRTLIANNSITDKISVSSRGNNVIFGGLAGINTEKGTLYYTYSNANLTIEGAGTLAGGLVGENTGAVKGSYIDIDVTGKATGTASQSVFLGGLIGRNSAGTVEQSYTSSKVTAEGVYTNVGGLIGELTGGSVKNSYVAKSVSATAANSYAGGFIGRIKDGKVTNAYSAAEVSTKAGAYAGGFAGRYDNASKELLYKTYYIKDDSLNINKDLPDFAEGNHRWLNVHVRLTTILSATLKDRTVFPELSGWDFNGAWKYGSLNASYKYPEVNREANTGGDVGNEVNANINWYMKDKDAIDFQITTEAELAGLAAIVNGTIAGVDKFNFTGRTITVLNPIHIQSKQWVPIGDKEENAFEGAFDGGNQLIDGLTLQPVFTYSGLFGVIGVDGTVSNINLEPLSVTGNQFSGALAGLNLGTVSNVDLKLLNGIKISGGTVGGVIGKNTGDVSGLKLTLDGGSRIETVYSGGIAGGIIGENVSDLIADTYSVQAIDGSIGSSADQAVVGGIVGSQAGDVTGLKAEVSSNLRVSASGMNSMTGGLIGAYSTGSASDLEVNFTDGVLEARGADSILGGVIGQAAAGTKLKNITVTGPASGVQLNGNGTVGGIVGIKEGALGGMKLLGAGSESNTFDIEHVKVENVKLATVTDSLEAVIGGITGRAVNVAMNDSSFAGTVAAPGETVAAGGIVGQSENTILYKVEAAPVMTVTTQTGEAAAGGIAGTSYSDDIDLGFDFGKAYPLYRGIYLANVHNGAITVTGTDNKMDLYAGGLTGRNTDASIYLSNSAVDLKVSGGKTVNAGGIAGYSNGIIVDAFADNSLTAESGSVYNVGGIVGWGADGEIHHSEAASGAGQSITIGTALTLDNSLPSTRAGGIVGLGDHMIITYTHAGIPVNITDTNKDNTIYAGGFGGLLGETDIREGQIKLSYATGALNISGKLGAYVGGFVGSVDRFSISDSYAAGNVTNTALDTRSGGFAAAVERNASISSSYALQSKVSTTGIKSATRSFTGGFAGYNDGTLNDVYANVPGLSASAPGADFQQGSLVGYNFRDGKVNSSRYVGELSAVGKNAGANEDAVKLAKGQALNPLASGMWNIDYDITFLDSFNEGAVTLNTPAQLIGAVLLYNETGLDYYHLYNRTANGKPEINTLLLGGDIDLGGKAWVAFDSFKDKFDGQGYTLSGLKLAVTEGQYTGFVTENLGEITNVNVAGAAGAGKNTGVVAGINRSTGVISGVTISATLKGTEATGSAAGVNEGTINEVVATDLMLTGTDRLGGIAGMNTGTVSASSSSGNINGSGDAAGGIAGVNAGAIENAGSTASISGNWTALGGIAGRNAQAGTITAAESNTRVNAPGSEFSAGGIAGINTGTINNSSSGGRISSLMESSAGGGGVIPTGINSSISADSGSGKALGGIAGRNTENGTINNAVSNAVVESYGAEVYAGGIAGVNEGGIDSSASDQGIGGWGQSAGGVAGLNTGAIQDSTSSAMLGGEWKLLGGIAGENTGTIENSGARGGISGSAEAAGGITGANAGTISTSSFGGSFSGQIKTAGGIAGLNEAKGSITDSISYADVNVNADEAVAGGIAGFNSGSIDNSLNAGRISSAGKVNAWSGGIAGFAISGSIESSLNTGEVRAAVNGLLTPGAAFFGGIAGQKSASADISDSVFNFQMLKNNIAYFDAASKPVAGNPSNPEDNVIADGNMEVADKVYAANSVDLVTGTLYAGLNEEHWTAVQAFNPGLKAFAETAEGSLSTASVILDSKDLINRVASGFTLGGNESVNWSAEPSQVEWNGNAGKLVTEGGVKLTVSVEGASRSIVINEPAVKYPVQAVTPSANSEDKYFITEMAVELVTQEQGARIYYTLDGSTPNETSLLYSKPVVLKSTTTINAVTIIPGKEYSNVFSDTWFQKAVAPTAAAADRFFVDNLTVVLKTEEPGGSIYYTLDGSKPDEKSQRYSTPIVLEKTTTINAITVVKGKVYSDVLTETWFQKAKAPELVSGEQNFMHSVSVKLATKEPNGIIYYTLDGSTPNETSLLYKDPILLTDTTTVNAITIAPGKVRSDMLTGVWTLAPFTGGGGGGGGVAIIPVKEPAITAVTSNASINGDSEAPVKVARNSKLKLTAPEGQVIYYTLDGSTPTVNSTKYTGELLITGNMTIKMITDQDDKVITIEYAVENAKYNLKSTADEVKYMTGYTDGTFKPSAAITRYELIASLAPLLDMENVNVGNLFTDVTAEHDKLTAFFASAGIIQGYPDGGFGGTKGLTRAEFAKIMTTVLNLDVTAAGLTKQSDLKGHWSEQYVNALSKAGYVQGFPDGTFKPNAPITRAEAVVMINRIVGTKKLTVSAVKYKDLPATHWAFKDIMSAVQ